MAISIRDRIESKPSAAIDYAIKGLERLSTKPFYVTNLHTYGFSRNGICHGCAATAAIQEIAGKDLDESNIDSLHDRAKALEFDEVELMIFENAINSSRIGDIDKLLTFCGLESEENTDVIDKVYDFWYSSGGAEISQALAVLMYARELLRIKGL